MYRKPNMNVESLSRKESKKLRKIRETKVRQAAYLEYKAFVTYIDPSFNIESYKEWSDKERDLY